MLKDDSLCNYATSVLFNLCVDFGKSEHTYIGAYMRRKCGLTAIVTSEPAQKAIYQARINSELIGLISSPGKSVDIPLGLVCKLLGFVATQGKTQTSLCLPYSHNIHKEDG
jgi:hypothetical protein